VHGLAVICTFMKREKIKVHRDVKVHKKRILAGVACRGATSLFPFSVLERLEENMCQ